MRTGRPADKWAPVEPPVSLPCKGLAVDDEEMARRIAGDLQSVLDAIHRTGTNIDAVLLSGSLGRSEATTVRRREGVQLLSDYDLFIVTDAVSDFGFFRRLETPLAGQLWGSHASLGLLSTSGLPAIPASVWSYDVRYGSRILEGDPATLVRMPSYSPTDIPIWEGLKLAFNYSGVLLAALEAADPEPGHPPADPTELRSSLVRLAYRLGDLLILLEGRYHHLLSRRRALLPTVRAFEELDEADRRLIVWGYEEKLRPQAFWTFDPDETMARLFPLTEELLRLSLRHYLGCAEPELPALLAEYRRGFPASPPVRSGLRQLGARLFGRRGSGRRELAGCVDRFHYILSVVPLALLASSGIPDSALYREEVRRLIGGVDCAGSASGASDAGWRAVRAEVLRLWKAVCL